MDSNNSLLNTICDLKWNYPIFNLSRGEFRSCCRTPPKIIKKEEIEKDGIDVFLNSKTQKDSRLSLLRGERHSDCTSCWELEKSNMKSPRHDPIKFWEHLKRNRIINYSDQYSPEKLKEFLNSSNHDEIINSNSPYMLELNLGNLCDMKCMYCNHHYSSQWSAELIKWGEISEEKLNEEFPKAPPNFDDAFWKWFNTIGRFSLDKIGIIGGEPLVNPQFYLLIDDLIESVSEIQRKRRRKINLWVVSNFNTSEQYLEKFLNYLPKLSKLFNVSIHISIESIEKKAEYIRFGLNWNRFVKNIDRLLTFKQENDIQFNFSFMPSINVLSVSGTLDFLKFVENTSKKYQTSVDITQNVISFPNWQSPLILTPDFATYLDESVNYITSSSEFIKTQSELTKWSEFATFLSNIANSIRTNESNLNQQRRRFADWFNTYDHRRKVDMFSVFPEYEEFYKLCFSL